MDAGRAGTDPDDRRGEVRRCAPGDTELAPYGFTSEHFYDESVLTLDGKNVWLSIYMLREPSRHQGIGHALLKALEAAGYAIHVEKAFLTDEAKAMLEHVGFVLRPVRHFSGWQLEAWARPAA